MQTIIPNPTRQPLIPALASIFSITGNSTETIPSALAANYDGNPHNPVTFTYANLSGAYDSTKVTQFDLSLDSNMAVGNGTQVRISYDFTGDGTWDRAETYNYFPTDPV